MLYISKNLEDPGNHLHKSVFKWSKYRWKPCQSFT